VSIPQNGEAGIHADHLARAQQGIQRYLAGANLAKEYLEAANREVIGNLREWLLDPEFDRLSPNLRAGIRDAIDAGRWSDLVNAFVRKVKFGTGGIRGLMAFDMESIRKLMDEGIDARILKGPNTINNIVVMQAACGVARFFNDPRNRPGSSGPARAVVGYDSRVQGAAFARAIAGTFLAEGLEVRLFDDAVPYPEVTFAIPHLGCDFGVFISASHNDYRYNGFKISGANGAQVRPAHRNRIIELIRQAKPADLHPVSLASAPPAVMERLSLLGGGAPLPDRDYFGREGSLYDVHAQMVRQIDRFILRRDLFDPGRGVARDVRIVYSAFNGAGRVVVPLLLEGLGFTHVHRIGTLDRLNGLFPSFKSAPGEEQQPDPGDPRAAVVALRELAKDKEEDAVGRPAIPWTEADLLIGTDPDADRCGVILKPPPPLARLLGNSPSLRYGPDHMLVPADDMWALILWYRLQHEVERFGAVRDAADKFLALSHTTSDVITRLVHKHGIGVLKTWVGFGLLSTGVAMAWKGAELPRVREGRLVGKTYGPKDVCDFVLHDTTLMDGVRTFNIAALEQSNGFSILGGPPDDPDRQIGRDGHVRDKDGTFAALLVAEIAAYARQQGTDILTLLARHIYADPRIGLFVNYYEPDPLDGEYPGLEGDTKKKSILDRAAGLVEEARRGGLVLAGRAVTGCSVYWTGKYDADNYAGFPDEGMRLFLGSDLDHLTLRPSGTTNSLRFHVQLHGGVTPEAEVWPRRLALEAEARRIVDELRRRVGALRREGAEL